MQSNETPREEQKAQGEEEKKKGLLRRPIRIWRLALPLWLVLIAGCCILSLGIGGIGSLLESAGALPTPTPTQAPTHTPLPTETSLPTNTPAPTNTPQPSNTPEPTNTREPTSTPPPTNTTQPTAEPQASTYQKEMIQISEDYITALNWTSELASEASEDPMLMYDDTWRTEMASALVMLRDCNSRVRQLDPPPAYQASYEHLLDAADHFDAAVTYMVDGIDEMDPDLIAKSSEHMSEGADCMGLATDALP